MRIATLGPEGSNHALIARRYLERHGSTEDAVLLYEAFHEAFEALMAGEVERVLQCTAHFSHADCVGRYMHRAYPVDTLIAGSRPLALLARAEVDRPRSVGRQPATRFYTDLDGFTEQCDTPTIVAAAEGLLAGRFDAAICALEVLGQHPESLRLVKDLGPALDVWVLYGTTALPDTSSLVLA